MLVLSIIQDLLLIAGYGLTVYGTYLIYKPSSFIIAGAVLIIAFRPKPAKSTSRKVK